MGRLVQTILILICFASVAPSYAMADDAAKRAEIDNNVTTALNNLYSSVPGSQNVVARAAGVLVFPEITKAGFIVGGQSGDGALRVGGKSVGYYKTAGASFGLQAGAEQHSVALVFMTPDALQRFENSNGWDVGADASVQIVQSGYGGKLDASQSKPVQVYIYGTKGLMGSISLEGTKITKSDL